jgi:hypothetical protein
MFNIITINKIIQLEASNIEEKNFWIENINILKNKYNNNLSGYLKVKF